MFTTSDSISTFACNSSFHTVYPLCSGEDFPLSYYKTFVSFRGLCLRHKMHTRCYQEKECAELSGEKKQYVARGQNLAKGIKAPDSQGKKGRPCIPESNNKKLIFLPSQQISVNAIAVLTELPETGIYPPAILSVQINKQVSEQRTLMQFLSYPRTWYSHPALCFRSAHSCTPEASIPFFDMWKGVKQSSGAPGHPEVASRSCHRTRAACQPAAVPTGRANIQKVCGVKLWLRHQGMSESKLRKPLHIVYPNMAQDKRGVLCDWKSFFQCEAILSMRNMSKSHGRMWGNPSGAAGGQALFPWTQIQTQGVHLWTWAQMWPGGSTMTEMDATEHQHQCIPHTSLRALLGFCSAWLTICDFSDSQQKRSVAALCIYDFAKWNSSCSCFCALCYVTPLACGIT